MRSASFAGLERFVEAQSPVYPSVLAELGAGRKTSHWMWFVFPQLKSLGRSGTARFYGLEDRAEAVAYSQHPVLGERVGRSRRSLTYSAGASAASAASAMTPR